MKLSIDQVRDMTTGAVKVVFEEGMYRFYRFNSREAEVIDNPNVLSPAGVQMRFKTDGQLLKLKIHTQALTNIRSYFSFDVFINDTMTGSIQNLNDEDCRGDYANNVYPLGCYQQEFKLGDGDKYIRLVFPHSVNMWIEDIEVVDATYAEPVKWDKTVIFFGDSITQGYDALHPSKSYAARLAEVLNANVINKALGGAIFDPKLVEIPYDIKPDYVIVAYGTNDWNSVDLLSFKNNAAGFRNGLEANYSGIPVFVITPVWRHDWQLMKKCGAFSNIENAIKDIFGNRENITVISGFDLIPHSLDYYGDLWVHPNDAGFEHYSDGLKKFLSLNA